VLFSYEKGVGYVKLTDKQKKEIVAKYVSENVSQRELAKRYQTTQKTISKILNNEKVYQSISNFEDENTLSMLAYVNEKRGLAQRLITIALESVEGKLKDASLKDTIGAIEKLSNVFKDGLDGNVGDNGEGNANELRIVVEKKVVDLSKEESNADDQL
jgi:predicted DNA-binding protein YlxM (UPF0122 family)